MLSLSKLKKKIDKPAESDKNAVFRPKHDQWKNASNKFEVYSGQWRFRFRRRIKMQITQVHLAIGGIPSRCSVVEHEPWKDF